MNSMKHNDQDTEQNLTELVFEYEVLSQKGTVVKYEKTVFCKIADYYEKESNMEKAIDTIDHALRNFGFSIELAIKKINLLIKGNRGEEAIEYIEVQLIEYSSVFQIQYLKAKAYISCKQYEVALSIFNQLSLDDCLSKEELSSVHLAEAGIFERRFEFEKMYYALKEAILQNPKNNDALIRMWLCVELNKKFDDSLVFHKALIDQDPYSYLAWFNIGHAYHYKRNYKKAIHAYELAYAINPNFELAYRDCAEVCMDICNYRKALKCYQELLSRGHEESEIYVSMGICHEKLKNTEEAKLYFYKATGIDDHNDEAYFNIGRCFADGKQWGSAIHYFEKAIALDDRREEYWSAIATAYVQIGNQKEAINAFEMSTEVAPEMPIYWLQFACYYLTKGNLSEALDVLDLAGLHAVGAELDYCKGVCLMKLGRKTEALEALHEALTDNFDMHQLIFDLDKSLKQNKDIKAILRYFQGEQ